MKYCFRSLEDEDQIVQINQILVKIKSMVSYDIKRATNKSLGKLRTFLFGCNSSSRSSLESMSVFLFLILYLCPLRNSWSFAKKTFDKNMQKVLILVYSYTILSCEWTLCNTSHQKSSNGQWYTLLSRVRYINNHILSLKYKSH